MTWEGWINKVVCMDCLKGMEQMPPGVVHCVVSSPPYFGLRDYQTEGQMGLEKSPDCRMQGFVRLRRDLTQEQKEYVARRLWGEEHRDAD